ncbi:MAG: response regulator transcription factor [Prochloraceae cyanobacterium]|nr:response regulator transcription factor [Prochloraceae cyanobacterium]
MKILLIDNNRFITQWLKKALTERYYVVDVASDREMGWDLIATYKYDLLIIKGELSAKEGIDFVRKMRSRGYQTPILMLIDENNLDFGIQSLDAGADDYILKPYSIEELLARTRALLRRGQTNLTPVMEWGDLKIDPGSCEVTYSQQRLKLTPKEYRLLELFMRNGSRVLSPCVIRDNLWSFDEYPQQDAIKSHVKRLRQKLKRAGAFKDLIETVYGLGYRLNKKAEQAA